MPLGHFAERERIKNSITSRLFLRNATWHLLILVEMSLLRYEWKVSIHSIQVRLLTPEDAESFRELRLEALRTSPEAFGSTYEAEKDAPVSKYADWMTSSRMFGAFQGKELVGIVALTFLEGSKACHKGLLRSMYVSRKARKAGVGRQLVEAVVEASRGRIELLLLAVVSENDAAIGLYEGIGFRRYGLEKRSLKQSGKYYDEVLMALDLTSR